MTSLLAAFLYAHRAVISHALVPSKRAMWKCVKNGMLSERGQIIRSMATALRNAGIDDNSYHLIEVNLVRKNASSALIGRSVLHLGIRPRLSSNPL
jgi:hypothetical protein